MPNLSDYNPAVKYGANLDVNIDLGDIRDANNNELLELDTVASAVNYIRIANSATGNSPVLTAVGDDTNIGLTLTPAGTGLITVGDSNSATSVSGSAIINAQRGRLTLQALSAATASSETVDLINNKILASSQIIMTLDDQDVSAGLPVLGSYLIGVAGSATIRIVNADSTPAGAALAGTVVVNFLILS